MRRRAITGLCLLSVSLLSGCSYLESLSYLFTDVEFAAKPVMSVAPPHEFRVGDVYRYRVGDLISEEKVVRVAGQDVYWLDNHGRQWVTDGGTLVPPKEYQPSATALKSLRTSMESTGSLYPLLVGKSVAFRFTKTGGGAPPSNHTQDCTVNDYGGVVTAAGPHNVYKLTCHYDGDPYINYYAPKIGRVVLQTGGSIFAGVERELVSYQRGGGDARMAAAKPNGMKSGGMKPGGMKPGAPHSDPAKMGSSKTNKAKPHKTMAARSGANPGGFGIQVAAYTTPKRARAAWKSIQRRGGGLLAKMTPAIERHAGKSGVVYRLVVGNFKSRATAAARCKALKRKRIDCWARPTARKPRPGHSAADRPIPLAPEAKSQRARSRPQTQAETQAVASAPPTRLYDAKP